MALLSGRDRLMNRLTSFKGNEAITHLQACIEIGDLLNEHLPKDTYIILQPVVRDNEIDILIISRAFGFRLIKVVSDALDNLSHVDAAGLLLLEKGDKHSLAELKKTSDMFQGYLIEHFSYLGTGDPYRNIGCSVIFSNFNRKEFTVKFAKSINGWTQDERTNFGRYHLFRDDMNENIKQLIVHTTKFLYGNIDMSHMQLKQIVNRLEQGISQKQASVEGKAPKAVPVKSENSAVKQPRQKVWSVALIVVLVLFLAGAGFFIMDIKERKSTTGSEGARTAELTDVLEVGDYVKLKAKVIDIEVDPNNDTHIVTLSEAGKQVKAIIATDIDVNELEIGATYHFEGLIETIEKDNQMELEIVKVRPLN